MQTNTIDVDFEKWIAKRVKRCLRTASENHDWSRYKRYSQHFQNLSKNAGKRREIRSVLEGTFAHSNLAFVIPDYSKYGKRYVRWVKRVLNKQLAGTVPELKNDRTLRHLITVHAEWRCQTYVFLRAEKPTVDIWSLRKDKHYESLLMGPTAGRRSPDDLSREATEDIEAQPGSASAIALA